MKCFHWLKYCLKIGWDKKDIDALEKLWFEHHDEETGEVIREGAGG